MTFTKTNSHTIRRQHVARVGFVRMANSVCFGRQVINDYVQVCLGESHGGFIVKMCSILIRIIYRIHHSLFAIGMLARQLRYMQVHEDNDRVNYIGMIADNVYKINKHIK